MTWNQIHPDLITSKAGVICIDAFDRSWLGLPIVTARTVGGQCREFNSVWFAKRWCERQARKAAK